MSAELMCQVYEGQLSKYTNVLKGWQFRWFVLDPKTGILSYYINENERRLPPRGWMHLEAAVISPSDEDSNTFTMNSSSGDVFKLRAQDAKVRQEWVNRLRAVAEMYSSVGTQTDPSSPAREHLVTSRPVPAAAQTSTTSLALSDALVSAREHLFRAEQGNYLMQKAIESLPSSGQLKHVDPNLLILKASSHSMLTSLNQCLFILHQDCANVRVTSCNSIKSKVSSTKQDHSQISHGKKTSKCKSVLMLHKNAN